MNKISPSRLEINFRRLLSQCNTVVSEGKLDDWRLEKYVETLETMVLSLRESPSPPNNEVLTEYSRQVDFLKGLLHADKLPSPSEKVMASQMLTPSSIAASNRRITKEIQLKTTGKYTNEMRKELFGNDEEGLRRRTTNSEVETIENGDYDVMLKYHQNMQEKIAEEMVLMARNLKENSLLAGTIVRKDTETIEKSTKLADQNYDRLKVESARLEVHNRKGCNWFIWIMLVVVCAVFVFMIFFMKLFRK